MRAARAGGRVRAAVLLEAVVALLLMAICLGAVAGLFSRSMARIRQAVLRSRAMLLAEDKLAEIQLGLVDLAETKEGDFKGKPPGFRWSVQMEPLAEVPELQRLTLTVNYDEPGDAFEYRVYRYFSPSLNFSYAKLMDVASDPSKLTEVQDQGLRELLEMLDESGFPGKEQLLKGLMVGGMSEMLKLYNRLVTGEISPEEIMSQLADTETAESSERDEGVVALMASSGQTSAYAQAWSDFETAGLGVDPILAAADGEKDRQGQTTQPGDTAQGRQTRIVDGEEPNAAPLPARAMTRSEAMKEIMRMLSRMQRQKK